VALNRCRGRARRRRASPAPPHLFAVDELTTVTLAPNVLANFTATWPRLPSPATPTCLPRCVEPVPPHGVSGRGATPCVGVHLAATGTAPFSPSPSRAPWRRPPSAAAKGAATARGPEPRQAGVAEQRPSSPMPATALPSSSRCTSRPHAPPAAHAGGHCVDVAHNTPLTAGPGKEGSPGREIGRARANGRSSRVGGRSPWSACCSLPHHATQASECQPHYFTPFSPAPPALEPSPLPRGARSQEKPRRSCAAGEEAVPARPTGKRRRHGEVREDKKFCPLPLTCGPQQHLTAANGVDGGMA
jgi:hypothetical protein